MVMGRSATLASRSAGTLDGDPCHAPATKAKESVGICSLLFRSFLFASSPFSSLAAANAIGNVRANLTALREKGLESVSFVRDVRTALGGYMMSRAGT